MQTGIQRVHQRSPTVRARTYQAATRYLQGPLCGIESVRAPLIVRACEREYLRLHLARRIEVAGVGEEMAGNLEYVLDGHPAWGQRLYERVVRSEREGGREEVEWCGNVRMSAAIGGGCGAGLPSVAIKRAAELEALPVATFIRRAAVQAARDRLAEG